MTSRERLLTAINCQKPDHIPLSFMIFSALRERLKNLQGEDLMKADIETQIELGLDAFVDLRHYYPDTEQIGHTDAQGMPVRFDEGVVSREWAEDLPDSTYPILHKEYNTPTGKLSVIANKTDDWPYYGTESGGYLVPLMDDFLEPRCKKFLVENRNDLIALKHLLLPPTPEDIKRCNESWEHGKSLANKHNLLLAGGWGVGSDALAWFCGHERVIFMALEDPGFLHDLLDMIHQWNIPRMQTFLNFGVDLFIRRAWYEGTDFWSPDLFKEFFFPVIQEEIRQTHEAGAKYGYILTSGSMPLHEMLLELDIDVLIGVDPVQGKGTDMAKMKDELKEKICLWGGVNGFVTVEMGTRQEIDDAVYQAVEAMGPEGLILSPVDNIRDPSDEVWEKVLMLIEAWEKYK
jgi:uroporphyrinogen-III decarboxylase